MDTDETVRILQRLNDDEGAPARVDLTAVVTVGRRRRRRRRISAGLASAAAVAVAIAAIPLVRASLHLTPPRPKPPTFVGPTSLTCTEQVLTLPGGGRAAGQVWAGDPTGRYLAGGVNDKPGQFGLWDNGVPTVLTVPDSNPPLPSEAPKSAVPKDIASDGTVVGVGEWNGQSWVYSGGTFTDLAPLLPNTSSAAVAINDRGTIVGNVEYPPATSRTLPIIWSSATATPVRLATPDSGDAVAIDIDTDGTTVGNIVDGGRSRVIVWRPNGSYELLPAPPGFPVSGSQALTIRNGVIAVLANPDGMGAPFLYDLSTGRYTRLPDMGTPFLTVVGTAQGWLAGDMEGRPGLVGALYSPNTGTIPLPTSKTDPKRDPVESVHSISDDGSVIGGGDATDGDATPVYWSCR